MVTRQEARPAVGAPVELPEIATTAETARYLRISIPTLNRMRGEGKGPKPRYFGRSVRYRRDEVLEYVAAATTKTEDAA